MSTEDNKAHVRRGFEAVNQKNLAVFDELLTPDVVFHRASLVTLSSLFLRQNK